MRKIAVLIPTYKRPQKLRELIESFYANSSVAQLYFIVEPDDLETHKELELLFIENPDFRGLIYALNDAMAIGVLRALGELNLNCPRDIKVVGFDDITIVKHMNPPLTTVHVPLVDMGYEAVKIVHDILTGEIDDVKKLRFSYRLTQRESC